MEQSTRSSFETTKNNQPAADAAGLVSAGSAQDPGLRAAELEADASAGWNPAAEKQNQNDMLEERPSVLMRRFSIPCVLSLLCGALYNIVDQLFIANAPDLGSCGNAANTVVFPLTIAALAIAVWIGDGACAWASLSLGACDPKEAGKAVGNALLFAAAAGWGIMVVYFLLETPLLRLFGGGINEKTMAFARQYFFWINLGMPFYVFGQAMNPIIRADGAPAMAMTASILGALINVVLDSLLIYGLHWGMTGAALATILGQIFTAGFSIWYLFHLKTLALHKDSFALSAHTDVRMLSLGLTSMLSQAALVASMAAVQYAVTKYGALDPTFQQPAFAQIPLAVLGIVMKFFQIVISVAIGLAAGLIPVVGCNMGAGKTGRVRTMFQMLLGWEFLIGSLCWIVVEVFPVQLIGLFGAAQESACYTTFAIRCFRIYLCLMPLATLNKGCFIFLQAIGKAKASILISMCRELVFGVGLPLLLPLWGGLTGVLLSFPAADLLTFAIAVVVIFQTMKTLDAPKDVLLHSGI